MISLYCIDEKEAKSAARSGQEVFAGRGRFFTRAPGAYAANHPALRHRALPGEQTPGVSAWQDIVHTGSFLFKRRLTISEIHSSIAPRSPFPATRRLRCTIAQRSRNLYVTK